MRALIAAAAAAALAVIHPALAIEFKTSSSVSGHLEVSTNLGACGDLTFPDGETFVGQLTALAYEEGPGTQAATVRGVIPIVAVGSWSGCIPGGYEGANVGDGKYTLTGQSANNDYSSAKQCVLNNGVLTCA